MNLLALSFLTSGVSLSMLCAAAGLVFAFFLIFAVIKSSPGNARMQEIAGAIQEGAKAYLNRQVVTISAIAKAKVNSCRRRKRKAAASTTGMAKIGQRIMV